MTNEVSLDPEPEVEAVTVSSNVFAQEQLRLDAAHYAREKPKVRHLLEQCGYDLVQLGDLCEKIFNLPRFRRVYATNPADGWPYMTPGQLVMFRCYDQERLISKTRAPRDAAEHFVRSGWVLITCSGTVGRPILATQALSKYFLTHDLIRLVPKKGTRPGYIVAYLASRIGQTLLRDEYGGTIDHIEPIHVRPIPVPMLPDELQERIEGMVQEAYKLRDKANDLLTKAESLVEEALNQK